MASGECSCSIYFVSSPASPNSRARINLRTRGHHTPRYRPHSEMDCPNPKPALLYTDDGSPHRRKARGRTFHNGPHVDFHRSWLMTPEWAVGGFGQYKCQV